MKQPIKKAAKKVAPGLAQKYRSFVTLSSRINEIKDDVHYIRQHATDNRLTQLKSLLAEVEPYQPTYGLVGLIDSPARSSNDRCQAIEQYIGRSLRGMRLLDIGSSLGYVCYYFADRGGRAEGWEMSQKNAEVSRMIGGLNGINIDVKTKWFDDTTIQSIDTDQYDVVTILSVLHHILHNHGLEYTQRLMADLVRKTPLLIVELAKKGEDKSLFWDAAQPKDELAIFDLVRDEITIKKIGMFGNHLSKNKRPLYAIERKKTVKVNNKNYSYNKTSSSAYDYSEAAVGKEKRRYYWSDKYLIKQYDFEDGPTADNAMLIINELSHLLATRNVAHLPKVVDYELTNKGAKIVYDLIPGAVIDTTKDYSSAELKHIYKDVLKALASLHERGLFHNDVRSWNVMYDGKNAYLIDMAQVSSVDEDHDLVALMWVMAALNKGVRESTEMAKTELPPLADVPDFLADDYRKIKAGENRADKL